MVTLSMLQPQGSPHSTLLAHVGPQASTSRRRPALSCTAQRSEPQPKQQAAVQRAPGSSLEAMRRGLVWPKGFEKFIVDPKRLGPITVPGLGNLLQAQQLPWYTAEQIEAYLPGLESIWQQHERPDLILPEYLEAPFHVWLGNGNWPAAANGEAVMAFFAQTFLQGDPEFKEMAAQAQRQGLPFNVSGEARALYVSRTANTVADSLGCDIGSVERVVDLGCGTGGPTRHLANNFPGAKVTGIEASQHTLCWAQLRANLPERMPTEVVGDRVDFRRALAEDTGLASHSADAVTLFFVAHELPLQARDNIFTEARRLLRPGGVLAVVDHKQQGINDVVFRQWQGVPGVGKVAGNALAALLNVGAPEPYLRAYHSRLLAESFAAAGLEHDPAHDRRSVSAGQDIWVARAPM
jgi:SAM-dependent methyltransferase